MDDRTTAIGKKIDGSIVMGNIVVQTPAYLCDGDHINVIDEFQFLSFHNR